MGSLKALQQWCRIQCEDYTDVDIKNMSTSFRDGLAFCAIIHKHRPDLIDFDSLSKENVYENNRLAFEVAEGELGIPALLDPEDMVSMKVPDRLSIITYVSQYYNFFTNKSHANPPCMKRPSGPGYAEPAVKRPATPLEDRARQAETVGDIIAKRSTLSSICAACGKHVHLVQRFLVDGKLYHRNCFRCRECCSTLLPGSYKLVGDAGSLVCTHHFARSSLANQNGWPDLSKRDGPITDVAEKATPPESPPNGSHQEQTHAVEPEQITPSPDMNSDSNSQENEKEEDETNEKLGRSEEITVEETEQSTPPNPFDDSDEEEEEEAQEKEDGAQKPPENATNGSLPATPVNRAGSDSRPVPAPRRVFDPSPPPRPVPRPRPLRPSEGPAVNGNTEDGRRSVPVPRERSRSPGSQSSDTPKPRDPPWLALVQSEPKKKQAPLPPSGITTPPRAVSVKVEETVPATPPQPVPANPFDEDDDEEEEQEAEPSEGSVPPTVVASHPWYGITQATEEAGAKTPPSRGSPVTTRNKKRVAPKAPQTTPPALSTESLSSSSSEHGRGRGAALAQDPPFTKSVSEPSISGPGSGPAPAADPKPRLSPSPTPPLSPTNTSSAPATPQTSRSAGAKATRPPPPRPPVAPRPLIQPGASVSQPPTPQNKRTCKENPFNRKPSPSHSTPKSRPLKGPRPARPPAPGHGFPLIKRKVQSDQYIPVEDIHVEMAELEKQLDELEHRGVELEGKLRDNPNGVRRRDEEEERLLVDWFTLIHEKHMLVRREAELVYTAKQQNLEERQADVEYELRCLLNKPEKEWSEEDRAREKQLMAELVTIIEQRNQIINSMDQDRQREEEEDKLLAAMLKKKDFHGEGEKKKTAKFKPIKVLKRLSQRTEGAKGGSPSKEKS